MQAPLTASDIPAYRIFTVFCSLLLIIGPIHTYRGSYFTPVSIAGIMRRLSLKEVVYARLIKLFGRFDYVPSGGMSLVEMWNTALLGEHHRMIAGSGLMGVTDAVAVKCSPITVLAETDGEWRRDFTGLALMCDFSQTAMKLRRGFQGRMIAADARWNVKQQVSAAGLHNIKQPGAGAAIDLYATDKREAHLFLGETLLTAVKDFSVEAAGYESTPVYSDDRLIMGMEKIYNAAKDKGLSLFTKAELPAEKAYDTVAAQAATSGIALGRQGFALECVAGKCVVLFACKRGLFESDSLFAPSLTPETARLLYAVMRCADMLARHIDATLA